VATLTVTDTPARLEALAGAEGDLREAGGVRELLTVMGDGPDVTVKLVEE